jgi:AcrR family transcriptional regulator
MDIGQVRHVGVEDSRTARKRQAIIAAAWEVFLTHGYLGASMDEVAARAAVSKQTVYKHFRTRSTCSPS